MLNSNNRTETIDEQENIHNLKTSMFRREFKIQGQIKEPGQIGEPGQKDKLTYQSLISHIEIGLGKGYNEEITNAVVRSIQAGSQLCSLSGRIKWFDIAKTAKNRSVSLPREECHRALPTLG